jgi:hypothetical protein
MKNVMAQLCWKFKYSTIMVLAENLWEAEYKCECRLNQKFD